MRPWYPRRRRRRGLFLFMPGLFFWRRPRLRRWGGPFGIAPHPLVFHHRPHHGLRHHGGPHGRSHRF